MREKRGGIGDPRCVPKHASLRTGREKNRAIIGNEWASGRGVADLVELVQIAGPTALARVVSICMTSGAIDRVKASREFCWWREMTSRGVRNRVCSLRSWVSYGYVQSNRQQSIR
jgi:hypothetical protein